jgi:hypothetical protein
MSDNSQSSFIAILTVLITGGFSVVVAMINRIHKQINSRMTELLELTKISSHAEGVKEEVEKQNSSSSSS